MRASCGTQTQIISVRASLPPAAGTEAELGQRSTTTFADGARYSIYTLYHAGEESEPRLISLFSFLQLQSRFLIIVRISLFS